MTAAAAQRCRFLYTHSGRECGAEEWAHHCLSHAFQPPAQAGGEAVMCSRCGGSKEVQPRIHRFGAQPDIALGPPVPCPDCQPPPTPTAAPGVEELLVQNACNAALAWLQAPAELKAEKLDFLETEARALLMHRTGPAFIERLREAHGGRLPRAGEVPLDSAKPTPTAGECAAFPEEYDQRGYQGQQYSRCKACGRADGLDFEVTDEEWATIVPHYRVNQVLCLVCFDKYAAFGNKPYSLLALHFAGKAAAASFACHAQPAPRAELERLTARWQRVADTNADGDAVAHAYRVCAADLFRACRALDDSRKGE